MTLETLGRLSSINIPIPIHSLSSPQWLERRIAERTSTYRLGLAADPRIAGVSTNEDVPPRAGGTSVMRLARSSRQVPFPAEMELASSVTRARRDLSYRTGFHATGTKR